MMIQTTIYQNKDFSLIWKPHGIPSTFGKEKSFLDYSKEQKSELAFTVAPLSTLLPVDLIQFVVPYLEGYKEEKDAQGIFRHQIDIFGQQQEFGLLNRLDNDTAGFLYFARTPEVYESFKQLQKEEKIKKYYLAQVSGKLKGGNRETGKHENTSTFPLFHFSISFPVMHRTAEKMIAIQKPSDVLKGRGKEHQVTTQIEVIRYDPQKDISTLLVMISKGIRHQIRVHLASQGHPIIGDMLYGKKENEGYLHLRSIGFQIS